MALTSQTELRGLILSVLSSYATGRRSRAEVLSDIDEARWQDWSEEDLAGPETEPWKVNWKVRASFERRAMVREGLLTDDADGFWTLTPEGWTASGGGGGALPAVDTAGRLRELTDSDALVAAMDRFDAEGRDDFLASRGLEPSRDWFIRWRGRLYDSKPILSVAYGIQFPDRGRLSVGRFSGGVAGANRAVSRLGFESVTRAQLSPPTLGEARNSRTAIADAYGGDRIAGVIRLPGEDVINVFSDAGGPYADDTPKLTEPFGYRGEGLRGPHRIDQGGNALLERARIGGERVRFWYRPIGEPFVFMSWAVVLGRAWVDGQDTAGIPRPELDWQLKLLSEGSGPLPLEVEQEVDEASETTDDDPDAPEASATSTYGELVARVDERGQRRRSSGVPRLDFARSQAARRAVLMRANGMCESPRCTGMPGEPNRRGEPILDVDHVRDLALGGADHPENMAAICPNCHAAKTRGANVARWRRELLRVIAQSHAAALETD